ncbi:MAG: DUF3427 domain-containing protein [Bacteroidales bacterium]|nr:DUF3427 domain-containing protein [Bacteroidales bacterium]
MELEDGAYETLINKEIEGKLKELEGKKIIKDRVDTASSHAWLADYLGGVIGGVLEKCSTNKTEETIEKQVECANSILEFIKGRWEGEIDPLILSDTKEFLKGIYTRAGYTDEQIEQTAEKQPLSGYRASALFTGGGKETSIVNEIALDIATANRIDLLVSFIKFRGLCLIKDSLRKFVEKGGKLRVLTTVYMGATDPKAIEELFKLKKSGDVQIKASFNGDSDRLHAKVYAFYRNSGQHTAYIGSSNLSKQAITTGLEWNIRVTQLENPHIIDKTKATFEQYWTSEEFENIDTKEDLKRFEDAINRIKYPDGNQQSSDINASEYVCRFIRKPHQARILEKLAFERNAMNSWRNLVVAATGTGKTAISAFDYKDFCKAQGRRQNLLFVVHRERILKQARYTFRSVLVDGNFGQLWVGDNKPTGEDGLRHLFVSIQTLNSNKETFSRLGKDYYDYIVIDEAHHSAAGSYRILFDLFKPKIFVGLTATPERMDGVSLLPDFNNRIASEIRLTEALNQGLLCPFDYYCVADDESINLGNIKYSSGRYDAKELTKLYENNKAARFGIMQRALDNYVNDPKSCKAVCFCCSVEHADSLNEMLNENGYKSVAVHSRNCKDTDAALQEAAGKLSRGEINYICVADILNEGVDIPEIDTILFLRPTESLTVFLQQLGRGLRLADGKTSLTVLDFVATANKSFSYEDRFCALTGRSRSSIRKDIEDGIPFLPAGCSIKSEKMAQERILANINAAIYNQQRLVREIKNYSTNHKTPLTLEDFVAELNIDWRAIYNTTAGSWTNLLVTAGITVNDYERTPEIKNLEKGLVRLYHTNSCDFLNFIKKQIEKRFDCKAESARERIFLRILYYDILYYEVEKYNENYGTKLESEEDGIRRLSSLPHIVEELEALVNIRLKSLEHTTTWIDVKDEASIELHGCYSSDEIHLLCEGRIVRGNIQGTQYIEGKDLALVFVTTNKSDKQYSPKTLYKDYVINEHLFHWQSMNSVSQSSKEGQRIINQPSNGWKFLLFVRDSKKDVYGNTNAYYCLGFVDMEKYEDERPMNVTWKMQSAIPGFLLEESQAV